ncbi:adhesion G-protein coupled receptor G6 [Gadus chalcogrammus]|uniref:adhesion G-protein coupled receptor G6 n=1 Tax=Gadus chalcogrammus TaxID=1042646 RepID=UPI0024C4CD14|nr:adhesion G-protein coupled receptor G6 [Gadus chalcogrammus]
MLVERKTSKTSLGYISTPLVVPGRKRPNPASLRPSPRPLVLVTKPPEEPVPRPTAEQRTTTPGPDETTPAHGPSLSSRTPSCYCGLLILLQGHRGTSGAQGTPTVHGSEDGLLPPPLRPLREPMSTQPTGSQAYAGQPAAHTTPVRHNGLAPRFGNATTTPTTTQHASGLDLTSNSDLTRERDLSPGTKNTDALHIPIMEDASGSEVELHSAWGSETAASVNPHRSALVDHEQYDSLAIETTEDLGSDPASTLARLLLAQIEAWIPGERNPCSPGVGHHNGNTPTKNRRRARKPLKANGWSDLSGVKAHLGGPRRQRRWRCAGLARAPRRRRLPPAFDDDKRSAGGLSPSAPLGPVLSLPLASVCRGPPLDSKGLFYRVSFVVEDEDSELDQGDLELSVLQWLNETFESWSDGVYIDYLSVLAASKQRTSSYTLQALLVYSHSTNDSLGEALVSSRLSSSGGSMGRGLQLQTDSIQVKAIEHCPEESPLHYRWPKTRPTTTQHLPCFPNKEVKTSRTCMISSQNLSSYWSPPDLSNCTDIDNIELSAENAAEVAVQLADITNNALSDEEVSKVVTKVKELVNLVKVNFTLASTVVTIISNIMTGSESMPAAASEKVLRTVDDLVQKIEFEGPSVMISSRHLAVAVSALNASSYNGTSFSASIPPNNTDPQINFETDSGHPLAQVTLPASLLTSDSLSEAERDTVDRINFMFFSKNNFFQGEQDGLSLNSYVVASSVGNQSISNLPEPIEIHITHLFYQPSPNPVCMFWDFTMKDGDGGWNREGCRVSPLSNHNKTVCLCDHLTHFGILMDISGAAPQIDQRNTKILTFITYIGCGVSAIFSAATLLTYIAFEKLRRDYPSKILMNLSTSLLFLNMVFLLDGWLASMDADWLCVSVAVFLHYFLLTTFTWMGLESIHMYIALVKVFNTYIRRYILKFCLVGWGLPAVLVSVVVAVDRKSYGRQEYGRGSPGEETQGSSEFCWIQSPVVFYITCVGYFCLVFLMNVAMFVVVMQQICGRNGKRSNRTLREEVLRNLRSVISLTFLLGMTWGFALFAWGPVNVAFMYLFAIFNSLQGLFIFVFHCALKENVQKQWRRYLCCGKLRLADNSDWSKTPTNNTKKVSSENLGKSLSSSSFSSTTATWTSKAKATLYPFNKRHSNTGKGFYNQASPKCASSCSSSSEPETPPSSSSNSILPVSQMIDKVKGYCSTRSDNFYKNIILSDSFSNSTKF